MRTMPVLLASAQGGMGQWAWLRIAAVSMIVLMPGSVIFALLQRLCFNGVIEGAMKL